MGNTAEAKAPALIPAPVKAPLIIVIAVPKFFSMTTPEAILAKIWPRIIAPPPNTPANSPNCVTVWPRGVLRASRAVDNPDKAP